MSFGNAGLGRPGRSMRGKRRQLVFSALVVMARLAGHSGSGEVGKVGNPILGKGGSSGCMYIHFCFYLLFLLTSCIYFDVCFASF